MSTLKHGARAAQRAYNTNQLDRRCGWVREMQSLLDEMIADRGGADHLEQERRILIERIAFKTVLMRMREAAALKAMQRALPEVGRDFFTCSESLRRDMLALRSLDAQQQKASRTVDDWIEAEADEDAA